MSHSAELAHVSHEGEMFSISAGTIVEGSRPLALANRGLGVLASRDRAAVGAVRERWSAAPRNPDAAVEWRNTSGRRNPQLLRYLAHTESIHWFLAVLARQARCRSTEIIQLYPPRRASKHFHHEDRVRSVQPDAFGFPRRGGSPGSSSLSEGDESRAPGYQDRKARLLLFVITHPIAQQTITALDPTCWSS